MKATPEQIAANEAAVKEIVELFPIHRQGDYWVADLLMCLTAFPFKSIPECLPDLRRLAALSGGDAEKAMTISADEMMKEHENLSRSQEDYIHPPH